MPHRIFTLSSAPMPFNRAEDPPDHCMVCTYVYVSHCCNTPAHTTNTALSSSVSSPLRSSFIIPTGVRTKTASFHWVHVANSSTITKGDPIPYHRTVLLCACQNSVTHTPRTPPLRRAPKNHIRQASCLLIMPHVTYCYEGVSLSAAA
jgi:hypothetical protein